jgi:hypothetical protein
MYISKKEVLILVLSLLAVICLGNFMFVSLYEYAKTGADWVSALIQALGNIFGGVLGGIIAYIVAKYQIDRQMEFQNKQQLSATIMKFRLIRSELNNNKLILETIEDKVQSAENDGDFDGVLQKLSNNTWKNTIIDMVISDELLIIIDKTYTKIAFYKDGVPSKGNIDLLQGIKNDISITISKLDDVINLNQNYS